jgi:hypothetical protein
MQAIQTLISRYLEDKDEHIQLAAMVAIRIAGKGRRRISAATLIIHDSASRRSDTLVQFHGALRRVAAVAVTWIAVVAIDGRSFHYDVNDRFVGLR